MNAVANPAIEVFRRPRRWALFIGIGALVLGVIGAALGLDHFFRAYLVAYLFWIGIALGCLFLHLVHNVVGGAWGYVIRRFLEAGMGTLPLMAVLFIPVLIGMGSLFSWTTPAVQADPLVVNKLPYLNTPFFIVRAIIYFVIWIGMAHLLRKWSLERDQAADPMPHTVRMRRLGAGGVIVWAITCTFAYFDWVMSQDPHFFSSIYAATIAIPGVLAMHAFTLIVLGRVADRTPIREALPIKMVNDLGNLLMGFTIISTYLIFSQFLIIWMANLPEEVGWYIHRWSGGWQWIAWALAIFQFIVPLLILLSRRTKRSFGALAAVGIMLMLAHLLDLYFQVMPNFYPTHIPFSIVDVLLPIGIGGLFVTLYLWQLGTRPILPSHLPKLPERYHHD